MAFDFAPQCPFVYQELLGVTEIPQTPVPLQNFRLTNLTMCPDGAYDETTWPTEGCILDCANFNYQGLSLCMSTGYVTDEKSVLLMSCTTDNVTNNPTNANMESCEDFAAWIELENSTAHAVRHSQCGWCRSDRCIPHGFEDISKGPLANNNPSHAHHASPQSPPVVMIVLVLSVLFAMMFVTVTFINRAKRLESERKQQSSEHLETNALEMHNLMPRN